MKSCELYSKYLFILLLDRESFIIKWIYLNIYIFFQNACVRCKFKYFYNGATFVSRNSIILLATKLTVDFISRKLFLYCLLFQHVYYLLRFYLTRVRSPSTTVPTWNCVTEFARIRSVNLARSINRFVSFCVLQRRITSTGMSSFQQNHTCIYHRHHQYQCNLASPVINARKTRNVGRRSKNVFTLGWWVRWRDTPAW